MVASALAAEVTRARYILAPPTLPRVSFVIPSLPADPRLAALLDLLPRQGFAPGGYEVLVAAYGSAIGRDRVAATLAAAAEARGEYVWVLDAGDRPPVNGAATLVARMATERLDAMAFGFRTISARAAARLRYDFPRRLPRAPIMEGASMLSRHDFRCELSTALARAQLWRDFVLPAVPGVSVFTERTLTPRLLLRAHRATWLPLAAIGRLEGPADPDIEGAALTAQSLRGLVAELRDEGNPSENLALRLLRRAELVAVDGLWALRQAGASRDEMRRARARLREVEALPFRHLGRPEATLGVRLRRWLVAGRR